MNLLSLLSPRPAPVPEEAGQARMNFFDLANLLDNDGNLQVDIIYTYLRAISTNIYTSATERDDGGRVRSYDAGDHPRVARQRVRCQRGAEEEEEEVSRGGGGGEDGRC